MVVEFLGNLSIQTLRRQQRMDSAETIHDCFLPPEILEKILSCVWLSPLGFDERRSVFASVCLVSKTWIAVLTRILARDAFVLSTTCFQFYTQLFRGRSLVFRTENASASSTTSLSNICLTFTRQLYASIRIAESDRRGFKASSKPRNDPHIKYMRDLFTTFRLMPFLPNLRSFAVSYCPHEDKQGQGSHTTRMTVSHPRPRFITFSMPVVRLDLEYSITSSTPGWLLDELGLSGKRDSRIAKCRLPSPCAGPDLEHVSFPDDDDDGRLGAFLRASPHLQLAVDPEVDISVRILAASGSLPVECIIVHGAIEPSTYVGGRLLGPGQPPLFSFGGASIMAVRGTALGFMFEEPKKRRGNYAMAKPIILNTWRRVHVFMPRRK